MTRTHRLRIASFLLLALALASPALATGEGRVLNVQGRLVNKATGDPREGDSFEITVSIWAEEQGGTSPLYLQTIGNVNVAGGIYSIQVGPFDDAQAASIFNGEARWVEFRVDDVTDGQPSGETLAPRRPLAAAGLAINADLLDGLHASDLARAGHDHQGLDTDTRTSVGVTVLRDGVAVPNVTVVPEDVNGQPLYLIGRTSSIGTAQFDLALATGVRFVAYVEGMRFFSDTILAEEGAGATIELPPFRSFQVHVYSGDAEQHVADEAVEALRREINPQTGVASTTPFGTSKRTDEEGLAAFSLPESPDGYVFRIRYKGFTFTSAIFQPNEGDTVEFPLPSFVDVTVQLSAGPGGAPVGGAPVTAYAIEPNPDTGALRDVAQLTDYTNVETGTVVFTLKYSDAGWRFRASLHEYEFASAIVQDVNGDGEEALDFNLPGFCKTGVLVTSGGQPVGQGKTVALYFSLVKTSSQAHANQYKKTAYTDEDSVATFLLPDLGHPASAGVLLEGHTGLGYRFYVTLDLPANARPTSVAFYNDYDDGSAGYQPWAPSAFDYPAAEEATEVALPGFAQVTFTIESGGGPVGPGVNVTYYFQYVNTATATFGYPGFQSDRTNLDGQVTFNVPDLYGADNAHYPFAQQWWGKGYASNENRYRIHVSFPMPAGYEPTYYYFYDSQIDDTSRDDSPRSPANDGWADFGYPPAEGALTLDYPGFRLLDAKVQSNGQDVGAGTWLYWHAQVQNLGSQQNQMWHRYSRLTGEDSTCRFAIADLSNLDFAKQQFGKDWKSNANRWGVYSRFEMPPGYEPRNHYFYNEFAAFWENTPAVLQMKDFVKYADLEGSSPVEEAFDFPGFKLLDVTVRSNGAAIQAGQWFYYYTQRKNAASGQLNSHHIASNQTNAQGVAKFAIPDLSNPEYAQQRLGGKDWHSNANRYYHAISFTMPSGYQPTSYWLPDDTLASWGDAKDARFHLTSFDRYGALGDPLAYNADFPGFALVETTYKSGGQPVGGNNYTYFIQQEKNASGSRRHYWSPGAYTDKNGVARYAIVDFWGDGAGGDGMGTNHDFAQYYYGRDWGSNEGRYSHYMNFHMSGGYVPQDFGLYDDYDAHGKQENARKQLAHDKFVNFKDLDPASPQLRETATFPGWRKVEARVVSGSQDAGGGGNVRLYWIFQGKNKFSGVLENRWWYSELTDPNGIFRIVVPDLKSPEYDDFSQQIFGRDWVAHADGGGMYYSYYCWFKMPAGYMPDSVAWYSDYDATYKRQSAKKRISGFGPYNALDTQDPLQDNATFPGFRKVDITVKSGSSHVGGGGECRLYWIFQGERMASGMLGDNWWVSDLANSNGVVKFCLPNFNYSGGEEFYQQWFGQDWKKHGDNYSFYVNFRFNGPFNPNSIAWYSDYDATYKQMESDRTLSLAGEFKTLGSASPASVSVTWPQFSQIEITLKSAGGAVGGGGPRVYWIFRGENMYSGQAADNWWVSDLTNTEGKVKFTIPNFNFSGGEEFYQQWFGRDWKKRGGYYSYYVNFPMPGGYQPANWAFYSDVKPTYEPALYPDTAKSLPASAFQDYRNLSTSATYTDAIEMPGFLCITTNRTASHTVGPQYKRYNCSGNGSWDWPAYASSSTGTSRTAAKFIMPDWKNYPDFGRMHMGCSNWSPSFNNVFRMYDHTDAGTSGEYNGDSYGFRRWATGQEGDFAVVNVSW